MPCRKHIFLVFLVVHISGRFYKGDLWHITTKANSFEITIPLRDLFRNSYRVNPRPLNSVQAWVQLALCIFMHQLIKFIYLDLQFLFQNCPKEWRSGNPWEWLVGSRKFKYLRITYFPQFLKISQNSWEGLWHQGVQGN